MKNAEMKVVRFSAEDVIATSGYLLKGLFDGQADNATFTRYATVGTESGAGQDVWNTYMNGDYTFKDSKGTVQDGVLVAGKDTTDGWTDTANPYGVSTFNGWYTFDGKNTFTHIAQ